MPHIYINRKRSNKSQRKFMRKIRVVMLQQYRLMRDAFAQLSPLDESRIRHRAEREAKKIKEYGQAGVCVTRRIAGLTLAYKYTCQLLDTVVV